MSPQMEDFKVGEKLIITKNFKQDATDFSVGEVFTLSRVLGGYSVLISDTVGDTCYIFPENYHNFSRVVLPDTDQEFLNWVADRLVNVYGESENVDFVKRLRNIAK